MNKTAIEWVKNPDGSQGYTWNPITGCLNHQDGLCKGGGFPCYAYRLAHGRLKQRYLANKNLAPGAKGGVSTLTIDDRTVIEREGDYADPFYPRLWPERLGQIPLFGKALGIFVCDMSDLFGIGIPESWTRTILNHIGECQRHRFYLLTKQPQNLIKWSPFPDNCYVGVTATGYDAFNNALDKLKCIEAQVKFISIEPLLEAIPFYMERLAYCGINWLIIGAQTKPEKLPKIEWVQEVVEAADKADIRVFLKDNLDELVPPNRDREPFLRYGPAGELRLRQEMPEEVR